MQISGPARSLGRADRLARAAGAVFVIVSIFALAIALAKDFDVFGNDAHRDVYQVMLASFGSIAFFRSSFFTARVGKDDVDVGPSTLLKPLLLTVDNEVNRSQAVDRSQDIVDIMPGVSFEKCRAPLPALCFVLVEDIPEDRQKAIATAILKLSDATGITDGQKSKILGVYLMREVGAQVLKRAVDALGDDIRYIPTSPADQQSSPTP